MSISVLLNHGHFDAMNSDSYVMKGLNATHHFHVPNSLMCYWFGVYFVFAKPEIYIYRITMEFMLDLKHMQEYV